ncbi:MAG: hypothetical protein ABIQ09_11250 [Jatrophihabitantaceae bacterium]
MPPGGAGPAGSPRWVFAGPAQRRLAITALALALISTVIAVNAARAHPEHRVRTVSAPAPPAVAAVDASGCPGFTVCQVRDQATELAAAFARAFPGGQVLAAQTTFDTRGDRSYRTSLIGLVSDASTVSVSAQCVPGAPRSTPRLDRSNTASVDLAGNSVIEFRQLSVLVPGRAGCGVAVLLRTRGPAVRFEGAALALARDPAIQLLP